MVKLWLSMGSKVHSINDEGMTGTVIDVECHLSNNLPNIVIVGVANKAVDEAKERLRGAFTNSGLNIPRKRITLNLAPADIPKDGSSYDLSMAASILLASGQIPEKSLSHTMVFGELGLDGAIRPIRGVIGRILAAKSKGYTKFVLPESNLDQANLVPGIQILPVVKLSEFCRVISNNISFKNSAGIDSRSKNQVSSYPDFSEVIGQYRAKRALEIAAAGHHNVLLSGAPGTGKSMLAKAFTGILPILNIEETLEVTHIHSLLDYNFDRIIYDRPLRTPHHSASNVAIIGGGSKPKPGEISLAHRGVLFLDEMPEFNRSTIETLRQPLEDRNISVARAKDRILFPAEFILIGTRNPCPCGYYGTGKQCICTPVQILQYEKKLSGPIMDRVDLYIDVESVEHSSLLEKSSEEQSEQIRNRVLKSRERQLHRKSNDGVLNGSLSSKSTKKSANLSGEAKKLLDTASNKLDLSARAYMRTVKVARTIADLDKSESIEPRHVTEALQYRPKTVTY